MRLSPRDRRLNADYRSVRTLSQESSIFSFECQGTPPKSYRFAFQGMGLKQEQSGRVTIADHHEVVVELRSAYPRMIPNLTWMTPIYHPNISNNGVVCLGSYGTHWVPSLTLQEMATMLWDMIRYENFDSESPYNRHAAAWAKTQTDFPFPLDPRSIRDKVEFSKVALEQVVVEPIEIIEEPLIAPEPIHRVENTPYDDSEIIVEGIEIIHTDVKVEPLPATEDGIVFLD